MTRESVAAEIERTKPHIVYISGKTCTGKTTFANKLKAHGYAPVELDAIVHESVIAPFGVSVGEGFLTAYRDTGPSEQVEAFIAAANKKIREAVAHSPLVIEGAIAKSRILKGVFSGAAEDFYFVYFHPVHLELYMQRIRERFIAGAANKTDGLPKHFWDMVQKEDMDAFLQDKTLNPGIEKSIKEYTEISMKESEDRLRHLQEDFPHLHVVEV